MHIVNVELKDCAFSPETGQFHATLLMDADARRMCLRAAAEYQTGMRRSEVAQVLLDDALRQLERMPEYRNTAGQITVAADALPGQSEMALAARKTARQHSKTGSLAIEVGRRYTALTSPSRSPQCKLMTA